MEVRKKVFNIRVLSLIYVLVIASSLFVWNSVYNAFHATNMPTQNGFLTWVLFLYAIPTVIYSLLVIYDGLNLGILQPKWSKVLTVFVIIILVTTGVYYLYLCYPKLNNWVSSHYGEAGELCWYNKYTNEYVNSNPDMLAMQLGLYFSHISFIIIALLVFFKEQNKGSDYKTILKLALYFVVLAFLLFSGLISHPDGSEYYYNDNTIFDNIVVAAISALAIVPYFVLVYLINNTEFFEKRCKEWRRPGIITKVFLWNSIFSLIILSLSILGCGGVEAESVLVIEVYAVAVVVAIVIGVFVELISLIRSKRSHIAAIVGFCFTLMLPSLIIILALIEVAISAIIGF